MRMRICFKIMRTPKLNTSHFNHSLHTNLCVMAPLLLSLSELSELLSLVAPLLMPLIPLMAPLLTPRSR